MSNEKKEQGDERPGMKSIGRRRFLEAGALAATGSLLYAKPTLAVAEGGTSLSAPTPLPLPFHYSGPMVPQPVAGTVNSSNYSFTGNAQLDIDPAGHAVAQNFSMSGTYLSGTNYGPVTVVQIGQATGSYVGTTLILSGLATYQDQQGTRIATAVASGTASSKQLDQHNTINVTGGGPTIIYNSAKIK
jgi:hypothetical protein